MFCGQASADTREHVIPQWMHKRFNIKHESLILRNNTQIKYQYEVLPACKRCNTRFSKLERRISERSASLQELYVWALKVYCGLNRKDSYIPESRSNPGFGSVLS